MEFHKHSLGSALVGRGDATHADADNCAEYVTAGFAEDPDL